MGPKTQFKSLLCGFTICWGRLKATELEEQKGAKRRELLALGDNCRGGLTPTVKQGIVRKGLHWE